MRKILLLLIIATLHSHVAIVIAIQIRNQVSLKLPIVAITKL